MASARKKQVKEKEERVEPAPEEEEAKEEEGDQEEAAAEDEEGSEPEGEPPPRRTAKTRAPKRSATAPASRQKTAKSTRPKQPSLFARVGRERVSRPAIRLGGSILLSLLALVGLVVLFHLFAGSKFFALKGVDVIWPATQPGVAPLLEASEVEEIVKRLPTVSRGVLKADLEEIRKELKEKNPLIREVEVARLLPDRLRVSVIERRPVALARRSDSSVVCVDDDGMMFGDARLWRGGPMPPPINGLAEGGEDAKAINRQWIAMYKKLMADLNQSDPPLSSQIDEIIFKDDGVRLALTEKRGMVVIGNEDFRTRLNIALDILAAISNKDLNALNVLRISDAERLLNGKINYVNVNDPKRPVVGLDE